jgi:hypothetical protein
MYTAFNNVYEVFRYFKQTSILNGFNLDGNIFLSKFEILVFFIYLFNHILGLDFS